MNVEYGTSPSDYPAYDEIHKKMQLLDQLYQIYEDIGEERVRINKAVEKWKKMDPEPEPLEIVNGKAIGITPFVLEKPKEAVDENVEVFEEKEPEKKKYKRCCTIL